jgi:hypothetical protein
MVWRFVKHRDISTFTFIQISDRPHGSEEGRIFELLIINKILWLSRVTEVVDCMMVYPEVSGLSR